MEIHFVQEILSLKDGQKTIFLWSTNSVMLFKISYEGFSYVQLFMHQDSYKSSVYKILRENVKTKKVTFLDNFKETDIFLYIKKEEESS